MEQAVFTDCRTLIDNFVNDGSPTFNSFCHHWRSMDFQCIYLMQSFNIEVMQTTAAALHLAKRTICGRDEKNSECGDEETKALRRIGGLYLMYAIYFRQPTEEYVKVEVSLETWREMKNFVNQLPSIPVLDDVRYIFWKLFKGNAFRFTVLDYCVGLERLVDYDRVDEEITNEQIDAEVAKAKLCQELHECTSTQNDIPALTVLEDGYNEMKELLVTAEGVNAQTLPPTTIFKDIKSAFDNINKILEEVHNVDTVKENQRVECQKRSLRRKGYVVKNTTRSSDEESAESASGTKRQSMASRIIASRSKRRNRMSARTVFSEQLPADMLNDLQEHTESEDCDNDGDEFMSDDNNDDEGQDTNSNLKDESDVDGRMENYNMELLLTD